MLEQYKSDKHHWLAPTDEQTNKTKIKKQWDRESKDRQSAVNTDSQRAD